MSEHISSQSAAKLYGVTNDYIARLCRAGKISGVLEGRTWMADQKSLAEFFDRQGRAPLTPEQKSELLTSREAARVYRVTNDYIARLCRQGKLQGTFENGIWKVEKKSLDTFFAPRRQATLFSAAQETLVPAVAQPIFQKVFYSAPATEKSFPSNKKFALAAAVL